MDKKKIAKIELCYDIGDDLPDGAWWALVQEHGLEPEDFMEYWDEKNSKKKKSK